MSWALVVACSALIWAFVPFATAIRAPIERHWGRGSFTYVVLAVIAVASAVLLGSLRRRNPATSSYLWLAAVAGAYAWYAWRLRAIPEEAVHLLEYAVLGVLAFRALSHRVRDATIYLTATVVGAITGIVDEALQWLTPGRHWALGDIWINVGATALAQIAIAKAARPALVRSNVAPFGVRTFCRFAAVALALLALTMLNTPARIEWYAKRVPALRFLLTNESVMFEYGYLYRDPDAGVFRSRLDWATLRETDARRAKDAARILDAYPDDRYREFLTTYTPVSDPFVHEARVHLFSRDKHASLARDPRVAPRDHGWHATVAWRENLILEKYFGATLHASSRVLTGENASYLERTRVGWDQVPADERESWVSRTLVTQLDEGYIMFGLGALLTLLVLVERLATARTVSRRVAEETSA